MLWLSSRSIDTLYPKAEYLSINKGENMYIQIKNDGSLNIGVDKWCLGYWTDSGRGSCIYYRNNSIYICWDEYDKRLYFNLELHIGRLRIKADI